MTSTPGPLTGFIGRKAVGGGGRGALSPPFPSLVSGKPPASAGEITFFKKKNCPPLTGETKVCIKNP